MRGVKGVINVSFPQYCRFFGIVSLFTIVSFSHFSMALQDASKTLPKGHVVQNTEHHFQFTLTDKAWKDAELGTFSDGSAEFEMAGYGKEAHLMVFFHDDIESVTGYSQWRIKQSNEDIINAKCTELREFINDSVWLSVRIICEGGNYIMPVIDVYHYLQIGDKKYVELYGNYKAIKMQFDKNADSFLETLQTFEWLNNTKPVEKPAKRESKQGKHK